MVTEIRNSFARWFPPQKEKEEVMPEIAGGATAGVGLSKIVSFDEHKFNTQDIYPKKSPLGLFFENVKKGNYARAGGRALINSVVTPVIEESLFRGYMLNPTKPQTKVDKAKDSLLNSALFAAAHFDPRTPLKVTAHAMPRLFIAGTALCAMTEMTGDLWAATSAHTTSNAIAFKKAAMKAHK